MLKIFTIVTVNGKFFEFYADEVVDLDGEYIFSVDGDTVASFRKDNIAGYFMTCEDEEDDEDDA